MFKRGRLLEFPTIMRTTNKHLFILLLLSMLCSCKQELTAKQENVTTEPPAPVLEKKTLPIARIATRVADRLPHKHLNRAKFDDAIASNALILFLDSLDFDRSYFLAADIAEFEAQANQLDDQIKNGNTDFAHMVFDRFKEHVINRTAYVDQLLENGFDLTLDETYCWKRDEQPWPADEAARDELWRKKIKNEYVGRVAMLEIPDPEDDPNLEDNDEETEEDILSPEEFIRERYKQYKLTVETNFDSENILERYLSAFTQSYDPHSAYLSPRGVEDFDIHMSLSLVGIGAMLKSDDGAAEVTKIMAGGPAEADGRLQPGDKIIGVAQGEEGSVSILHWPLSKAVRLIRGEIGTKVVLTVIPAEDKTGTRTKKIDIIRAEVKLEESAAKGKIYDAVGTNSLPHRLGVVTLPEFYADFAATRKGEADARRVSTDVQRILEGFSTNDVDGVIIDLRNDGGGSLAEAIDITGQFIPMGPVVQVRETRGVSVIPDGDPSTLYKGPLVILVNRLSASASEILAAALQDYGRAIIVGDAKTHGKGTVQTILPLSRVSDDLGSLKVTTASFYRIAGGSTQMRGVTPDIILPSMFDALEIGEEFLPNALPWSQVQSAYFRPWKPTVKPLIPELKARSEERMVDNPAFKTFLARRQRLQDRMNTPEISLQLTKRVDEIRTEQELEDLQSSILSKDDDEKEEKDPILDETLLILSDLVALNAGEKLAENR